MEGRSKILFVCTHNRCRSVLGEVIANTRHGDVFEAYSAGSAPAGEVHPLTLRYLKARDLPLRGSKVSLGMTLRMKVWILSLPYATALQMRSARFGWAKPPATLGMPDPSRVEGSEQEVERAFYNVMDALDAKLSELRATIR